MFYYTYVLRSSVDNKLYIGWTGDLVARVKKHNTGKVPATKRRIPLKLVYYEACLDITAAIRREKTLKTGYGRRYLTARLTS